MLQYAREEHRRNAIRFLLGEEVEHLRPVLAQRRDAHLRTAEDSLLQRRADPTLRIIGGGFTVKFAQEAEKVSDLDNALVRTDEADANVDAKMGQLQAVAPGSKATRVLQQPGIEKAFAASLTDGKRT